MGTVFFTSCINPKRLSYLDLHGLVNANYYLKNASYTFSKVHSTSHFIVLTLCYTITQLLRSFH